MQVSYFENGRYYAPSNLPRQWPMAAGAYDREAGLRAFRGMVERSRYAEELLIVGMLRGTTNEMLTYDLNPEESRERTDEGMELILRAWTEPQPFGWQGRHFHYRTVSVWPKPLQQPLPPMYALGTSREASDFAARNHIGLGVSFGPFDAMGMVTG